MANRNDRENVHIKAITDIMIDHTENLHQVRYLEKWVKEETTLSPETILKMLAATLFAGLAYGNWPWRGVNGKATNS